MSDIAGHQHYSDAGYGINCHQAELGRVHRLIQERIKQHEDNLLGWREPDGHLVPTEPDERERWLIRQDLHAAITVLTELDEALL